MCFCMIGRSCVANHFTFFDFNMVGCIDVCVGMRAVFEIDGSYRITVLSLLRDSLRKPKAAKNCQHHSFFNN